MKNGFTKGLKSEVLRDGLTKGLDNKESPGTFRKSPPILLNLAEDKYVWSWAPLKSDCSV